MIDFAGLDGAGVRVAVVDSGIRADHPDLPPRAGGIALTGAPEAAAGDISEAQATARPLPDTATPMPDSAGRAAALMETGPACRVDETVRDAPERAGCDDVCGHGTACGGIIHAKAPAVRLYAVRVFGADLRTDEDTLIRALDWVTEQRMDVANLSLGIERPRGDALEAACRRATEAGVILVAAHHNDGARSYPAAFDTVISVAGGIGYGRYEYHWTGRADPEFLARGDRQRLCWIGPDYVMLDGTSFAAAHLSGVVALIRQAHRGASLPQVRGLLRENASMAEDGVPAGAGTEPAGAGMLSATESALPECAFDGEQATPAASVRRGRTAVPVDGCVGETGVEDEGIGGGVCGPGQGFAWLARAALYPFNKEMHALIRGRDLLPFAVTAVADPVGKGLVGRDAGEAIGTAPAGVRIQARLDAALEQVDSLVLGYVDRLGRAQRQDVLRHCVAAAVSRGKHVFSLLPVPPESYAELHRQAAAAGVRIVTPGIGPELAGRILADAGGEPVADVPVLGVFGTSSHQGKFTLQLILRRQLLAMGYRVAQIGTEHHAALFGMDLAFPMGYASAVDLPLELYEPFLQACVRRICRRSSPDILVAGAQSGTVAYDVHRADTHTLPTVAFLLGVRPDACILVVNASDPEAYVRDTIDALRTVARSPVLLLAMGDQDRVAHRHWGRHSVRQHRMSPADIDCQLHRLERRFGLPAACITDPAGQQRMVRVVIEYFADREQEKR